MPDKEDKKITDSSKFLPELTEEQLDEISTAKTINVFYDQDRDDAKQAWMIGAWVASQKADPNKAVRSYQWKYAEGYVKRELAKQRKFRERHRLTLDLPIGESQEETVVSLHASDDPTPLEVFDESATSEAMFFLLKKGFEILNEREKNIIYLRFMEKKTLEETASYFGVSRERIRQMEQRALRNLLRYFQDHKELHSVIYSLGFDPKKQKDPWLFPSNF